MRCLHGVAVRCEGEVRSDPNMAVPAGLGLAHQPRAVSLVTVIHFNEEIFFRTYSGSWVVKNPVYSSNKRSGEKWRYATGSRL